MKSYLFYILFFLLFTSCKKFLVVDPPANQATTDRVFASDATAIATVSGIYSEMMTNLNQFSAGGITIYTGMTADELRYYFPSERDEFINNAIAAPGQTTIELYFWNTAYKYIYAANLVMDKLNSSATVTSETKMQLNGEAKFIRAFCYFHLVNLFGDAPLAVQSDYRVNEKLSRAATSAVYEQIKKDLTEASQLLSGVYKDGERVRPVKWAAMALLARVNLYLGDWDTAETLSTSVINSGVHSLVPLNNVFLKNSNEAIWQLLPVNPTFNTWEGFFFLPASATAPPGYVITNTLLQAFEVGDQRFVNWVANRDYQSQIIYYPSKYDVRGVNVPLTEYYMTLRLAEQFLIRAEARAQQDKLAASAEDINTIRQRAGLTAIVASSKQELLLAIEQERRIELFAEWGHRWFDLRRTGRINEVLGAVKPGWQATDALWPIPANQIRANPALVQNPGY